LKKRVNPSHLWEVAVGGVVEKEAELFEAVTGARSRVASLDWRIDRTRSGVCCSDL